MDMNPVDLAALGKWALGVLVAFAGWTHVKLDARVEKLEDETVTKADFNDLKEEIREEMRGIYGHLDGLKDELIEVWRDR